MNSDDSTQATAPPRLSRRMRLQYEPAQTRWVLLYPEGMVQLNDSAAEILRRCDGSKSVSAIIDELEARFNVQGIAPQIHSSIAEGTKRGWLE